jgi:hypothetical protein
MSKFIREGDTIEREEERIERGRRRGQEDGLLILRLYTRPSTAIPSAGETCPALAAA